MTKRDLFSLTMKIFGVFKILSGIVTCVGAISYIASPGFTWSLLLPLILTDLFSVAAGYGLVRYSGWLGLKLIPDDKELQTISAPDMLKDIFILVLRALGIYLTVIWLPSVVGSFIQSVDGTTRPTTQSLAYTLLKPIVYWGSSIYLILGARQIAGWFYRKNEANNQAGKQTDGMS